MDKEGEYSIDKDKKILEKWIKDDYKKVQNYLRGNPGVEGFIDSLGVLEEDIGTYLFETLKTKKYGENPYDTGVYEKYMKGGEDRQYLESLILNKIIGKKVSIDSLVDDGLDRIKELFSTKEAFNAALEKGLIQNISINDVILPPDPKDPPEIGSGTGFEKKELEQDKFLLFMSMLKKLKIYDDDILIIRSGIINDNMMRENTYYAIYIPRINKTVFLNVGYGEASFVCNGEVSPEIMTTYGKEKLQSELGAIKIKFFEENIQGWENNFKKALLGEGGKLGEKVNMKKFKRNLEKQIKLSELKKFFQEHKDEEFTDSEGKKRLVSDVFTTSCDYYQQNYKIINEIYGICLPRNPDVKYDKTWNEIKMALGINDIYVKIDETMTLEKMKEFYTQHKDDKFIDSNQEESTIKKLFGIREYYLLNYKIVNKLYGINLPGHVGKKYVKNWNELKKFLGIEEINRDSPMTLEEIKDFYIQHKDDKFEDSEGNNVTIKDLFNTCSYYKANYKLVNEKYDTNLPGDVRRSYKKNWNEFKKLLGIEEINREPIMTFEEIKEFYVQHKDDKFEDSEGNEALVGDLFMKGLYYRSNYKIINKKYGIFLPSDIDVKYKKTWNEIKKELGIKEINRDIPMTLEEIKEFYIQHKDDKFEDSEGNEALVGDLFVKHDYYKANYRIVSQKYKINLPSDITRRYNKTRNEVKEELRASV